MRTSLVGALGLVLGISGLTVAQPAPKTVEIVSVTGCLREQSPGTWMVVAATEPVASQANAPPKNELPTTAPAGKLSFRLIGVGEFNLPAYKDKTVVARGLLIKDAPASRLNVTSVVEALPACAAGAPK
jgi:hypothetical protein